MEPRILNRSIHRIGQQTLQNHGIHPLLARLWAARGITHPNELQSAWKHLAPPQTLTQAEQAAVHLADAIREGRRMLVIADYDCDGATACAVAVRGLRAMGAQVDFLVPNRFETGYGLSPAVVDLACQHRSGKPHLLITVDNGIASLDGVAAATQHGIQVIVTDHHLPGPELPDALAIVNPNQPHCGFPSKNLAGVGVIFYVLLALRAELRRRGVLRPEDGPPLHHLADLLALGTVADVVKLDTNNRLLVAQGLERIRRGQVQPGVRALFEVSGRSMRDATATDLGFKIGPRINAAGRLSDMGLGIQCLLTDQPDEALALAQQLDAINRERRDIQLNMEEQALNELDQAAPTYSASLCVFNPDWHQGVIGLVASRLKERFWRPTLAFAQAGDGELKGSGRSVPDVHLRDALDLVTKLKPGLITKFGGHAMAAGLSLRAEDWPAFAPVFDQAVQTLTGRQRFEPQLETDGSLELDYATVQAAQLLEQQVWGAGFPAPLFVDRFRVLHQRVLKDRHLKLAVERDGYGFDAIWFGRADALPEWVELVYRLDVNQWKGQSSVQLLVEHARPAA